MANFMKADSKLKGNRQKVVESTIGYTLAIWVGDNDSEVVIIRTTHPTPYCITGFTANIVQSIKIALIIQIFQLLVPVAGIEQQYVCTIT